MKWFWAREALGGSPRRNRKGLGPEAADRVGTTRPTHFLPLRPKSLTWWIGVSFMVGASLFAAGAGSALFAAHPFGPKIFFAGSIFFTTAAYLQVVEVINEPDPSTGRRPPFALWRAEPEKIGWWAVVVQFVGTLLFNLNTFEGMQTLSPRLEQRLVWTPDALGSICFLIAGYLAYVEVCGSWIGVQPGNVSWWVTFINLIGSVAFGVAAVASYVTPTGDVISVLGTNLGLFIGACCFFLGAYLLLPEMTATSDHESS